VLKSEREKKHARTHDGYQLDATFPTYHLWKNARRLDLTLSGGRGWRLRFLGLIHAVTMRKDYGFKEGSEASLPAAFPA